MASSLLLRAAAFTAPFEGRRLDKYQDIRGTWTFGYGSLCEHYPDATFPVTEEFAQQCLADYLKSSYKSVARLITVPLNENQIIALIDFCYNLGAGRLQSSTLRKKINRGVEDLESEFEKYSYAGGRWSRGLHARRVAEWQLYSCPVVQQISQ